MQAVISFAICLCAGLPALAAQESNDGSTIASTPLPNTSEAPAENVFANGGIVYKHMWLINTNTLFAPPSSNGVVVSNRVPTILHWGMTEAERTEWKAMVEKWFADSLAEEERLGTNKEQRAYWRKLVEKQPLLKKGMDISEVEKVLGQPTQLTIYVQGESPEYLELKKITVREYSATGGEAKAWYSPSGLVSAMRPDRSIYPKLWLEFGADARLERWEFAR